jgi:uncharacterized protein (TIGR02246 family)
MARHLRRPGLIPALLCALLLGACESPRAARLRADRAEIEARLQRYSALVLAMDNAGIAAMFAPDGEMVNPRRPPVKGRAAIEKFLSGFSDYRVLSNSDVPAGTTIDGDTAEQLGTYSQRVRSPDGQVFEAAGRFEIGWVRDASGQWLLSQVATFPSK